MKTRTRHRHRPTRMMTGDSPRLSWLYISDINELPVGSPCVYRTVPLWYQCARNSGINLVNRLQAPIRF
jgi:hypothetical protein